MKLILQKSPLNYTRDGKKCIFIGIPWIICCISNLAVLDQVQLQYIAINRISLYHWSYQKMLKVLLKIKHLSLNLSFLTFSAFWVQKLLAISLRKEPYHWHFHLRSHCVAFFSLSLYISISGITISFISIICFNECPWATFVAPPRPKLKFQGFKDDLKYIVYKKTKVFSSNYITSNKNIGVLVQPAYVAVLVTKIEQNADNSAYYTIFDALYVQSYLFSFASFFSVFFR